MKTLFVLTLSIIAVALMRPTVVRAQDASDENSIVVLSPESAMSEDVDGLVPADQLVREDDDRGRREPPRREPPREPRRPVPVPPRPAPYPNPYPYPYPYPNPLPPTGNIICFAEDYLGHRYAAVSSSAAWAQDEALNQCRLATGTYCYAMGCRDYYPRPGRSGH